MFLGGGYKFGALGGVSYLAIWYIDHTIMWYLRCLTLNNPCIKIKKILENQHCDNDIYQCL